MRVKIDGVFFQHFDNLNVSFKLDSVASTFSFVVRFNPSNETHRRLFKPLSYPRVEIFENDVLMFTGVIVSHTFTSQSNDTLKKVSGYSLPGVIEDCTLPTSAYPLEQLNVSLRDVAQRFLRPFNIDFVVDASVITDMDLIYSKTVAGASESIKSYLAKLANQRNIVLSHDTQGRVVFFRPDVSGQPKYFFTSENTLTMNLDVNGQSIHSEIAVIRQPSRGNNSLSSSDRIINNLVSAIRPVVRTLSSGSDTDTLKAVQNALADELRTINLKVTLEKVLDLNVGDVVEVQNNELYLFNRTRFIVQTINIKETATSRTMDMNLVLPESFTGQNPKDIFNVVL